MQSAAATIKRSPRQAPAGAEESPDSSASATPPIAISTPTLLRAANASLPSAAPTSIVSSGKVDSASEPRAAVVKISDALNRIGNSAKYKTPSPATPGQSWRRGQASPFHQASGSRNRNPMPKRNEPMASGSTAFTR